MTALSARLSFGLTAFGRTLWAQVTALMSAGTDHTSDVVLQRKVVLVNASALVAVVGCMAYAGLYGLRGVWGLTVSSLLGIILALFYVAVWTFNRYGYFQLARTYFFTVSVALALGSILLGQGTLLLSHYFLLLLAILSLTFFTTSEWCWSVCMVSALTAVFLFFELRGWPPHPSLYVLSSDMIHLIRVVKVGTCVTVLMMVMLLTEFMMDTYVRKLDVLGRTDLLTGLPNRRWFQMALSRELTKVQRSGASMAIALVDLDHFKQVNDHYGHAVGDEALKHVAQQLKVHARAGDFVARIGGEEFVVLMQADSVSQAQAGAERLRAGIAALPFDAPNGTYALTASVGVALYHPGVSPNRLLRAADLAMYRAKHAGRNQVVMVEADLFFAVPPFRSEWLESGT